MAKATNAFWDGSRHDAMSGGRLLELFSPTGRPSVPPVVDGDDHRTLWAADAVHRAKNLAQLSSSFGSHRLRHLLGAHADERIAQAGALSRAYDELGTAGKTDGAVPCGALLETIATGLTALFGGDRSISLHLSMDHVVLPAERRRALLLIASELTINALKYAFPAQGGGTIRLSLTQAAGRIGLSVADDGIGVAPLAAAGSGAGLMTRLALLLGADMHRADNDPGLRVCLRMRQAGA